VGECIFIPCFESELYVHDIQTTVVISIDPDRITLDPHDEARLIRLQITEVELAAFILSRLEASGRTSVRRLEQNVLSLNHQLPTSKQFNEKGASLVPNQTYIHISPICNLYIHISPT
jgi:hypothetical protein